MAMRRLARIIAVLSCAALGTVLLAPPADAKLLPYELLRDSPRVGTVHEPVAVVMRLDPQNVFPATIDFAIHWIKVRPHQVARKAARRGPGCGGRDGASGSGSGRRIRWDGRRRR